MPTAWRIVKSKHAKVAFDGEGARVFGGRWNSPGTAVVYCSESLALAALELLIHLQSSDILKAYIAFHLTFPEAIVSTLDADHLPKNWRDYPPPVALQQMGDDWVASRRSAVLQVPSVIVESEHNDLLNPNHADFSRITIGAPQPFEFDPRLVKR